MPRLWHTTRVDGERWVSHPMGLWSEAAGASPAEQTAGGGSDDDARAAGVPADCNRVPGIRPLLRLFMAHGRCGHRRELGGGGWGSEQELGTAPFGTTKALPNGTFGGPQPFVLASLSALLVGAFPFEAPPVDVAAFAVPWATWRPRFAFRPEALGPRVGGAAPSSPSAPPPPQHTHTRGPHTLCGNVQREMPFGRPTDAPPPPPV